MDTFGRCHRTFAISRDKRTMRIAKTCVGDGYHFGFGSRKARSTDGGSFSWKVRIGRVKNGVFIGLASHKNCGDDYSFNKLDYGIYSESGDTYNFGHSERFGCTFRNSDTVSLTADFAARTLSFSVNKRNLGVAFNNIAIGPDYYFAVCWQPRYVGDAVTLLPLSKNGNSNGEEMKETRETARLKVPAASKLHVCDDRVIILLIELKGNQSQPQCANF